MLGIAQTAAGIIKIIVSEGTATDGEIMKIGNTQTHVRFPILPDEYMDKWFKEAPTHHFALSVGKNVPVFKKIATLIGRSTSKYNVLLKVKFKIS